MNQEIYSSSGSDEGVVCPSCLQSNPSAVDFCIDCGAPLGVFTTVDPLKHIFAEGFTYRKVMEMRPKLIILLGMWLLFFPLALLGALVVCLSFDKEDSWLEPWPEGVYFIVLGLISLAILYRVTRHYFVDRQSSSDDPFGDEPPSDEPSDFSSPLSPQ